MIYVGIDWSEEHHDVAVMTEAGELLVERRVEDTMASVSLMHALFAEHTASPVDVIIGVETVHNLVVRALVAAGYSVYEVNPLASSRYRDRHHLSGAKSDKGDAKLLADLVRTDRHNHRIYAGSSSLSQAIKLLARAHQNLILARQDHLNEMRSALRQFYPAALAAFPNLCSPSDRDCPDAMGFLECAPTPSQGKVLTRLRIRRVLAKAGRQRNLDKRAAAIEQVLRDSHLGVPDVLSKAYGVTVRALAQVVTALTCQIAELEQELARHFEQHPDAKIIRSLPGLGPVLAARALGEFGDEPNRFSDPKARKNYATTSPVTRASGKVRIVSVRHGGNRRLGQVCIRWAYSALTASTGARRYYDDLRSRNKTHAQATRAVANRLVGILHGCLAKRQLYSEEIAWPTVLKEAA